MRAMNSKCIKSQFYNIIILHKCNNILQEETYLVESLFVYLHYEAIKIYSLFFNQGVLS